MKLKKLLLISSILFFLLLNISFVRAVTIEQLENLGANQCARANSLEPLQMFRLYERFIADSNGDAQYKTDLKKAHKIVSDKLKESLLYYKEAEYAAHTKSVLVVGLTSSCIPLFGGIASLMKEDKSTPDYVQGWANVGLSVISAGATLYHHPLINNFFCGLRHKLLSSDYRNDSIAEEAKFAALYLLRINSPERVDISVWDNNKKVSSFVEKVSKIIVNSISDKNYSIIYHLTRYASGDNYANKENLTIPPFPD